MDRDKQIIVGVAALLLVGGGAYFAKQKDDTVGKAGVQTTAALPSWNVPDNLDSIEITTDKGKVVLVKQGEGWNLSEPLKASAHAANVKTLIEGLKALKPTELVLGQASAEQKKSYELEGDKAVHVVAKAGATTALDIAFGKSGGRGQMAAVAGSDVVFAVSGYSSFTFARELKGWRDTEVLKFDDADVTGLEIDNTHGRFAFTKGASWTGTLNGRPIAKFGDNKVGEALRAFKSLSADDFGDGKSEAETGLDKPALVKITLKDGAGSFALKVGGVANGGSHWAQKEGAETIYSISSWPSDWALADASKFQKDDEAKGAAPSPPSGMPDLSGMGLPPGFEMPGGHGPGDGHGH